MLENSKRELPEKHNAKNQLRYSVMRNKGKKNKQTLNESQTVSRDDRIEIKSN